MQYLAGHNWLLPRNNLYFLKASTRKERALKNKPSKVKAKPKGAKNNKAPSSEQIDQMHLDNAMQKSPYSNMLTWITGCNYQRSLVATPPIFDSTQTYAQHLSSQHYALLSLEILVKYARLALQQQLPTMSAPSVTR